MVDKLLRPSPLRRVHEIAHLHHRAYSLFSMFDESNHSELRLLSAFDVESGAGSGVVGLSPPSPIAHFRECTTCCDTACIRMQYKA
ncbi:unnamed protein product [Hydatigera taeniaeformis]|uniref:Uncharacterized protein n=1 Tax=Hydatigena taeniaeformis TaxID=6205 RepID=A0A0R3XDI3_HYDTA|nr:unnamed protein product [Hydatigera taeniaeformis]